jgi:2-haloacid dehalogenase
MVAAHKDDLEAARKQGLKTAYVPRPSEYGPRKAPYPALDFVADVEATGFVDLAGRLGA